MQLKTIGTVMGTLETRILETIDQSIGQRLKRVEENEKLSAKVHTEKKDEVLVNLVYAPEPGAPDEDYKKALQAAYTGVKTIERTTSFQQDKFNFIYILCKESNKIANNFNLSKTQQMRLIMAMIPPCETFEFLSLMAPDLKELFKLVSAFATNSATKQAIERDINAWRLPHSSSDEINMALVTLFTLLDKNREDYNNAPVRAIDLYKRCIEVIIAQHPSLPRRCSKSYTGRVIGLKTPTHHLK